MDQQIRQSIKQQLINLSRAWALYYEREMRMDDLVNGDISEYLTGISALRKQWGDALIDELILEIAND